MNKLLFTRRNISMEWNNCCSPIVTCEIHCRFLSVFSEYCSHVWFLITDKNRWCVLVFSEGDETWFDNRAFCYLQSAHFGWKILVLPLFKNVCLQSTNRPYVLFNLQFFTLDHLAILDSEEILRLYDISIEQEVESFNLTIVEICYNSSAFKALAIGGTVSEALASHFVDVDVYFNIKIIIGDVTHHASLVVQAIRIQIVKSY